MCLNVKRIKRSVKAKAWQEKETEEEAAADSRRRRSLLGLSNRRELCRNQANQAEGRQGQQDK